MELKPGAKLGPYEILSPIGAGGMGQVWKARDTRLGRMVAIKVSAAKFSERFAQEARAIAALNHTNICTLYDVGPDYLVMEYVEGQEIKGPLPLDQALALGIQLAGALEAAHRKGITHRDLKPANILTTKSGVKVLDFGLAKVAQTKEAAANDETVTRALTQEGSIVGTLQYMAPEQLQGKETDARADIFSFGCVLFEMLTGKRAFDGANAASVIAAVMEREAPSVGEIAPAALDRTLRRCLEKDPDERWQTVGDLKAELLWIAGGGTEVPRQAEARPTWVPWAAAGVLATALAFAGLAVAYVRHRPAELPTLRYTIAAPEKTSLLVGGIGVNPFSVSPDGRRLVFRAQSSDGNNQLWVRSLDSLAAQPLAGTEGGADPFWSPDSKSIGFSAGGKVKKLDLAGGTALALADNGPYGGAWGSQGDIVFPQKGGGALVRIQASGGSPIPVTKWTKGEPQHAYPWFLPDGRHFLFVTLTAGPTGHYQIRMGSLDSLESKALLEADSTAIYSEGRLLFVRESTLMAQPFDLNRSATTGEAAPVAEHVRRIVAFPAAIFSASAGGLLAYSAAEESAGGFSLAWLDRSGARLSTLGDPRNYFTPQFSPDRKSLAVRITPNGNSGGDIWVFDVARGVRTRFTFDTAGGAAIWSPDGRTIVYGSSKSGHYDLYRKASDGTSAEELLYSDDRDKRPTSWSPDGKFLLYSTGGNTWVLPLTPEKPGAPLKPFLFAPTAINGTIAQFSPDGRWVSYQSNEFGRAEIYAAPFPGPGGKRQVSLAGGALARWRRDGKEIYFIAPDRKLMAAEVNMQGTALEMGAVHPLFGLPTSFLGNNYDVSLDGQKFLAVVASEQQGHEALLTVVQNWTEGLKK